MLLRKRPRAETTEVDLYGLARDTRAEALVGRVGLAQSGPSADGKTTSVRAEDADPFRFRSWLFGSIGDVEQAAFEGVRERVLESTPSFLRRNIRGLSASEHFFHLFLAFLHDAESSISRRRRPPRCTWRCATAWRSSTGCWCRRARRHSRSRWPRPTGAASSRPGARTRCATCTSKGISDCPVCHAANDRSDPQRSGRRIPHEALRAVVVEANRDVASRPGWHDIPDRSALIVGADRQPVISSL